MKTTDIMEHRSHQRAHAHTHNIQLNRKGKEMQNKHFTQCP